MSIKDETYLELRAMLFGVHDVLDVVDLPALVLRLDHTDHHQGRQAVLGEHNK